MLKRSLYRRKFVTSYDARYEIILSKWHCFKICIQNNKKSKCPDMPIYDARQWTSIAYWCFLFVLALHVVVSSLSRTLRDVYCLNARSGPRGWTRYVHERKVSLTLLGFLRKYNNYPVFLKHWHTYSSLTDPILRRCWYAFESTNNLTQLNYLKSLEISLQAPSNQAPIPWSPILSVMVTFSLNFLVEFMIFERLCTTTLNQGKPFSSFLSWIQ